MAPEEAESGAETDLFNFQYVYFFVLFCCGSIGFWFAGGLKCESKFFISMISAIVLRISRSSASGTFLVQVKKQFLGQKHKTSIYVHQLENSWQNKQTRVALNLDDIED